MTADKLRCWNCGNDSDQFNQYDIDAYQCLVCAATVRISPSEANRRNAEDY